ncbi:class I tRNA ligase family protein, partial [Candidatus Latescibacterota bacterium]
YLMFLGPYTQGGDFQDKGIMGVRRFYDRIYRIVRSGKLSDGISNDKNFLALCNKTVRDVTGNIKKLEYNTAIAFMMELLNGITKNDTVYKSDIETLIKMSAPFAPHLTEEMWEMLGHTTSVFDAGWPEWDESKIELDTFQLVAQVNGKVRANMEVPSGISKEDAVDAAVTNENVMRFTDGKTIVKTIYVPGKLVNIVVK